MSVVAGASPKLGAVDHRDGLRVLRCAPHMPVRDALVFAGMSLRQLRKQARSLQARSGYASAAAVVALGHRDPRSRKAALKHPDCPPYAARVAGADNVASVRGSARGVAGWSSGIRTREKATRASIVAAVAGSSAPAKESTVASEVCPPLIQTAMCSPGESVSVREYLANPFSTLVAAHVAAVLAADVYPSVRQRLVQHPDSPRCVTIRLASDFDDDTRAAVARLRRGSRRDP